MVVGDQMVEGLAGRGEEGQNQQILQETEAGLDPANAKDA